MRDDFDNRTPADTRGGMSMGAIAAIVIAAVLIIGALFLWPHDSNQSASNNNAPSSTVGQTRSAPAPTTPAPAPAPAAPAAK
jgi:hypothetical protein